MNTDQIKGNWKILAGRVRERWGRLTDDDLDVIRGQREQLIGRVQRAYGLSKEQAQREVEEFERSI